MINYVLFLHQTKQMKGFIHTWFEPSYFDIYKEMNKIHFSDLYQFYLYGFEVVNMLIFKYLRKTLNTPNKRMKIPMCFTHSKYHGLITYTRSGLEMVMIDLITSMKETLSSRFINISNIQDLRRINEEHINGLHNVALIFPNNDITEMRQIHFTRTEAETALQPLNDITGTVVILRNTDISSEDISNYLSKIGDIEFYINHQANRTVPQFVQYIIDIILFGKPISCIKGAKRLNIVDMKIGQKQNPNSEGIIVQHELFENVSDCLNDEFHVEEELIKDINIMCREHIENPSLITKNVKQLNKNEWTRQLAGYSLYSNFVNTIIECKHKHLQNATANSIQQKYENYSSEFNEMFKIPYLEYQEKQLFLIYVVNDEIKTQEIENRDNTRKIGYICSRSNLKQVINNLKGMIIKSSPPHRLDEEYMIDDNQRIWNIRGLSHNEDENWWGMKIYDDAGHYNEFIMIT